MKKRCAFMTALLMLSSLPNFSVCADETTTTGAYIPGNLPVSIVEDTNKVVVDNIEELEEICQKLHTILDEPTVYVAKRDGCVVFGSESQTDIDNAKIYCQENGIDLDMVCFILIREEMPNDTVTTEPYIPSDVPVDITEGTTNVAIDNIEELEEICKKLHTILDEPTVYVAKRDGCVVFGSENQTDIDNAKTYCKENGIDLNLICFILIREEMPNDTVTTGPYIPSDVVTETTTVVTSTTTREKIDPAKVEQLNAVYEQLKQFECKNNIIFYNAGYNDKIVFCSYDGNMEVINKLNQYIADNGIDKNLVVVETAVPELVEETEVFVKGDVSGDGEVSLSDVVMLQKYLAKKIDIISKAADLNEDGKVNAFDLILLKRMTANEPK